MRAIHSFWVIFFFAFPCIVVAHIFVPEVSHPVSMDALDSQLTDSLLSGQIHQPEVYFRALNILTTLESAPSCHRIATLTLINSCQSLERSVSTEVALYETREEYATKLAMCELDGAKAAINSHCLDFVPSPQACRKQKSGGFFARRLQVEEEIPGKACYPEVTRQQVKSCISALHSKPQWWTSYSNALQNVVVVCQASRNAIEKDEVLEQFKKAAAAGSDITDALAESFKQSRAFVSLLHDLQSQFLRDREAEMKQSRESHSQFLLNLQNAVYGMIRSFRQGTDEALESVSKLKDDVNNSRQVALETNAVLKEMRDISLLHAHDFDATHLELWQRLRNHAGDVEDTLQKLNANLPILVHELRSMRTQINENTDMLLAQQFLIKDLLSAGPSQYMVFLLFAIIVLVANHCYPKMVTWAGIVSCGLVFIWVILRSILQIIAQIPFINVAPLSVPTLSLPSYEDVYTNIYAKICAFVMTVSGVGLALYCVCVNIRIANKKRRASHFLEGPLSIEQPFRSRTMPSIRWAAASEERACDRSYRAKTVA